MNIKSMPKQERPRERLEMCGAFALSDAELLAIFLRTGIPGINAVSLAHHLLNKFGSLSDLLKADRNSFCQHKGLGPAKFVVLQAVMEMARRCLSHRIHCEDVLSCQDEAKAYLQSRFYRCEREIFLVLFLDIQNRVIRSEALFSGTINRTAVHVREVVKAALACNAAAIILAHNHPSGGSKPSNADHQITKAITRACALVEVKVLDHFVVGVGEVTSCAESRLAFSACP